MNSGAVTEAAQRVGIFGAGKSGTAIARRAVDAGYTVKIAASGPADQTAMITNIVTPGVIATDSEILPPTRTSSSSPFHSAGSPTCRSHSSPTASSST
jgi:UDP-N-acetylmuramoylalanine-D-glutamate ligase